MSSIPIYVMAGPTAVGKGTVVKQLMSLYPRLAVSISATTRPPRPGEQDGVDYFFVSDSEFDRLVEEDGLLEWATVHGKHRYGTPRAQAEKRIRAGEPLLLEIDLDGARQVRQTLPEATFIFLVPPSWEELERRLAGRGTEQPEEQARRLRTAKVEMAAASEFEQVVTNDNLDDTVRRLAELMRLD